VEPLLKVEKQKAQNPGRNWQMDRVQHEHEELNDVSGRRHCQRQKDRRSVLRLDKKRGKPKHGRKQIENKTEEEKRVEQQITTVLFRFARLKPTQGDRNTSDFFVKWKWGRKDKRKTENRIVRQYGHGHSTVDPVFHFVSQPHTDNVSRIRTATSEKE